MIVLGLHTQIQFFLLLQPPVLCLSGRRDGKEPHSDAFGLGYGIGSVVMLGFGYTNVFLPKALDQAWLCHSPRNVMECHGSCDASVCR